MTLGGQAFKPPSEPPARPQQASSVPLSAQEASYHRASVSYRLCCARPEGHSEGQHHPASRGYLLPKCDRQASVPKCFVAGRRVSAWLWLPGPWPGWGLQINGTLSVPAGTLSRSWSAYWMEASAELLASASPLRVWVKKYAAWAVAIAAWTTELQSTSTPQGHNIFSQFTTRSFILEFLCQLRLQGGDSGKVVLGPSKRESCNWAPVLKKGARKQQKSSKAKKMTFTRQQPWCAGGGETTNPEGLYCSLPGGSAEGLLEPKIPEKLHLRGFYYNERSSFSLQVPWGVKDHAISKASPYPPRAGVTGK